MNFSFNKKMYRVILFLFCAILFQQHLVAQIEIFIVPNMDKSDTFTTMEPAAKRWFDLNRKSDDKEDQRRYISCKRSEAGSSVIVVLQRSWINRAGSGGADKPERVTDDPTEETTSIQIEQIVPDAEKVKAIAQPAKAVAAAQKQKDIAAINGKTQKDESKSNFSPLVNIPTPSPVSMPAINARAKQMASTFVDITRDGSGNTNISLFEAEGAAIMESSLKIKIRALKEKEKGDFAIASGAIRAKDKLLDVTDKTVDQMGIPAAAVSKFKLDELKTSITAHFKKDVNFILLDVRHLAAKDKEEIKGFLITDHSANLERLITIGF